MLRGLVNQLLNYNNVTQCHNSAFHSRDFYKLFFFCWFFSRKVAIWASCRNISLVSAKRRYMCLVVWKGLSCRSTKRCGHLVIDKCTHELAFGHLQNKGTHVTRLRRKSVSFQKAYSCSAENNALHLFFSPRPSEITSFELCTRTDEMYLRCADLVHIEKCDTANPFVGEQARDIESSYW